MKLVDMLSLTTADRRSSLLDEYKHTYITFGFFIATITMSASPAIAAAAAAPKKEPGQSWKANETQVLPHNRLSIVSLGMSRSGTRG